MLGRGELVAELGETLDAAFARACRSRPNSRPVPALARASAGTRFAGIARSAKRTSSGFATRLFRRDQSSASTLKLDAKDATARCSSR